MTEKGLTELFEKRKKNKRKTAPIQPKLKIKKIE